MSEHEGNERRATPRADVCMLATVLVRFNDAVALTIENISTGGAHLVGPLAVDLGERVQILFEVDGHPIEVAGEVIRTEMRDMITDRVSVKFVDVDDETTELLRQFVHGAIEREERRLDGPHDDEA